MKTDKIIVIGLFLLICVGVRTNAQTQFKSLNYLYSISGTRTLSGQHNDQKDGTGAATYTNRVFSITGKYPALYSADFLFHGNNQMRWDITYEAERQWNAGAVVNIMWHACPPTQGAVCNWDGGLLSYLNDSQWNDLITNGGYLNGIWKQRIDEISVYLQYLEDKGVEVLWRPLHEMNQGAFWWGGRTGPNGSRRLYQITRDYMQNVKGLTNLIWVWDVQDLSTNYGDYNPGSNYYDVAALDVYGDAYTNSAYYNALVTQAGSKPVAIGECGTLPGADVFQRQPRWTFFMNWAYLLQQNNSDQYIRDVYNDPRVITRDEMPGWGSGGGTVPNNLATNKPVFVSSTEAGGNVGANAVDNSYSTRWSSAYSDPQWITVDLGGSYNVNRVKITWEAAYAVNYQVQFSTNNSTWTTARTITNNCSLVNDHAGISGTARYVRIYGTTRATQYGYSIYALEVYGTLSGGGSTNLAYNRPVSTTSNENATNTGAKAVDANGTTRWSSAYANNQNFVVDLGAAYNVNRVRIAWEAAYARDYQIQFSTDNVNWTTVREFWGKSSAAADDQTGLSGVARWVKIYCINRATQYGFSFWEFEVYGSAAGGGASESLNGSEVSDERVLSAYPNPVEKKTTLVIDLPEPGNVVLDVSNNFGKRVADVYKGTLSAGVHKFDFDTDTLASGIYIYSITFKGRRVTKKLIKQ
jgi:beta-mannanase